MRRANPFGDLDDFASDNAAKPAPAATIEKIAESSGFLSRKAAAPTARETATETVVTPSSLSPALAGRQPRRHVTGRNGQINIKATEETISELYRIADDMGLPLGALLEQALAALDRERRT